MDGFSTGCGTLAAVTVPARPASLPPQSRDRKVAETEGMVRSALMEQQEEEEQVRTDRSAQPAHRSPVELGQNGKKQDANGEWFIPDSVRRVFSSEETV